MYTSRKCAILYIIALYRKLIEVDIEIGINVSLKEFPQNQRVIDFVAC